MIPYFIIYNLKSYFFHHNRSDDGLGETYFKNEIEFYKKNKDSPYIPKMYFPDITREVIPYYYEILERVEGQTLQRYGINYHKLKELTQLKVLLNNEIVT